ncbi:MAG: hypothetical protein JWQ01_4828 [Massilia sp.]|nr:hypothetical protein [Massilia sp.]
MNGTHFTMIGSSDYPVCDCCGKTNLTRAVQVANEFSEQFNIGVICASKVLRQVYQGKKLPVSQAAIISMGKAERASPEWKERNGHTSAKLVAA